MKIHDIGFIVKGDVTEDQLQDFVQMVTEIAAKSDPKGPDVSLAVVYQSSSKKSVEKTVDKGGTEGLDYVYMDAFLNVIEKHVGDGEYRIVIQKGALANKPSEFHAFWSSSKGWVPTSRFRDTGGHHKEEKQEWRISPPKYKRSQWIVSDKVNKSFEDVITLIKHRKLIYEDWHFGDVDPVARAVVCFSGPPGTGKTMAAHVIASELEKPILCANFSSVESMWVGEAPKRLKSVFKTAAENDAVLFFDEADSFLGKRIKQIQFSADQALNSLRSEMLTLLEEFDGIVIFSTNLIQNFDKAFESRILKFLEIELPNKEARLAIISSKIPQGAPIIDIETAQLEELAEISDGFSGREIRNAVLQGMVKSARAVVENGDTGIRFCHMKEAFLEEKDSMIYLQEKRSGVVGSANSMVPISNSEEFEPLKNFVQKSLDEAGEHQQ